MDFDYGNMGLAISLSNSTNFIDNDPSIFTFTMQYHYYDSNGNLLGEDDKILNFCNESDFTTHGDGYNLMGLQTAYCPTTGNFTIEGYWNEKTTKYLEINLSGCNNQTSNVICKSLEEISTYFQDKYFSIYYSDNIIDVNDFDNPIKQIYNTMYFLTDPIISKKITLNFKKVEFTSDDGLIFSNKINSESFLFDNIDVDYMTNNNLWVATVLIYSSSNIYLVNRRYQTLQEAVANLGGLANSLLIIGYLLTFLEKEFILFRSIINKLYIFPQESKITKKKKESAKVANNKVKLFQELNVKLSDSCDIPQIQFSSQDQNQEILKSGKSSFAKIHTLPKLNFISQIIQNTSAFRSIARLLKNSEDVSFSFFEFLKIKYKPSFFKMKTKELLVSEALNVYNKEMDVLSILQKLNEIDKLKMILLNFEQIKLFNMMAKPTITLNNLQKEGQLSENNRMYLTLQTMKESTHIAQIQSYFHKVKEEGKKASEIDQRLVKLIDEKAKM